MIGLTYTGPREEGISLILYRSYKTIKIRPGQVYKFTVKDDVSELAKRYYLKLRNLGVKIIESPVDTAELPPVSETRTEPPIAETDKQVDPQTPLPSQEDIQASAEISATEADSTSFSEMTEAELSEYLEMNLSRDQIKKMISETGMDITVGKKSESTLINAIIANYRDQAIAYLNKK